jgi:hypothetical protein
MQISELAILVIENPLLDITVDDNESVLHAKHGLEHGQASLVTEANYGIHDEVFLFENKQITPGGAALNSARAANYVLSKNG